MTLLVFDLDGTLIDSKNDIANAVNTTLENYGLRSLPVLEIIKFVGTGITPLIKKEIVDRELASLENAMNQFNKNYQNVVAVETRLFSGVLEVLEHFRATPKIVLTNKSNLFVNTILTKLDIIDFFVRSYGRESFSTQKPHPGPLLEISKLHSTPLPSILMIGDTETDILAGKNAGTLTCAVTYGYGPQDYQKTLSPNFIAKTPSDIKNINL